jgi:hypothetical protein
MVAVEAEGLMGNNKDPVIPQYHWVMAYFKVAPSLWIILSSGWIVVLFSLISGNREQASGSMLVGSALIAETIFERLDWRKFPNSGDGRIQNYLIDQDNNRNQNTKSIPAIWFWINLSFKPLPHDIMGALFSLTQKNAILNFKEGSFKWLYGITISRTESILSSYIILNTFVGTVLWGYGDLFFEHCVQ